MWGNEINVLFVIRVRLTCNSKLRRKATTKILNLLFDNRRKPNQYGKT